MLLEAPIVPTLARLALPNLVVMLMQSSVGLTETHFIGKLGTDALAGMALVFPPLMLVQMISAGAVGGGDHDRCGPRARAAGCGRRGCPGLAGGLERARVRPRDVRAHARLRPAALRRDGRSRCLAAGSRGLRDGGVRRSDPHLAVQLACRGHPRHRQHDAPGPGERDRRRASRPGIACLHLRLGADAPTRHCRRRRRRPHLLRRGELRLRRPPGHEAGRREAELTAATPQRRSAARDRGRRSAVLAGHRQHQPHHRHRDGLRRSLRQRGGGRLRDGREARVPARSAVLRPVHAGRGHGGNDAWRRRPPASDTSRPGGCRDDRHHHMRRRHPGLPSSPSIGSRCSATIPA